MMTDNSNDVWDNLHHVIPCALQRHFDFTLANSPFGGLSQADCREAFQDWVEHAYAGSCDALRCPMLWCREEFEDHQMTIRHTLRCSWLPNAWYWCPQHSKAERFMSTGNIEIADFREQIKMKDSILIVKTVPTQPMRRKSSKMRKAVTFFKHRGWRSASKEQMDFSGYLNSTESGTDNKGEIDSLEKQFWEKDGYPLMSEVDGGLSPSEFDSELMKTNAGLPTPETFSELPVPSITPQLMGTNAELPTAEIFNELPALFITPQLMRTNAELPTTEAFNELPTLPAASAVSGQSDQLLNPQNYNCPLPSYSPPRFATLECSESTKHLANRELAQCTAQHDLDRSELTLPDLRVYEMPTTLPQQPGASISDIRAQMEAPEFLELTDYISASLLPSDDVLAEVGSSAVQDLRFSYICGLADTQISVQDIHNMVGCISDEWLARLHSTPHLASRCSKLSSQDLFERGFKAMQQCFNGSLTDSFEDMFSLVHVAYACAYCLHKDEDIYDWDEFFVQIMQWQYLLSNQDDVQCFLMAMDQLTCEHTYHLTHSLSGGIIFDHQSYQRTFNMLKNGPVMRDCSMFLDGLQCKGLYQRNKLLLSDHLNWHARYLNRAIPYTIDEITTRLKKDPVTEGFQHIIDDVEFQLHAGLLRNTREVEIMLIINARTYAKSFEGFENYKRAVMNLCDRALEQPDSSWRYHYYAVVIDKVLEVGLNISKYQTIGTQALKQDISVLGVVRPHKSDGNSPLFATSAETEATDDTPSSISPSSLASASGFTSPSTVGSSTSGLSPSTDSPNSYTTSPTTASAGSPTSPAPQNITADVLRCPGCLKTFKGTSGPTNLQRHLKSSKAHGNVPESECHMAGCGKRFTRTDNMHHHIRTVHNESPIVPMQQRGGMKRRRESDATADIRPRGIRPKGMVQENAVTLQGQNYDICEKFSF